MSVSFAPHERQLQVLDCPNRFIAAVAGKRGGKSVAGSIWLIQEMQRLHAAGKRGHYLICAPTFRMLQQATLPTFREYFMRMGWGAGKNGGWHESKSCFQLDKDSISIPLLSSSQSRPCEQRSGSTEPSLVGRTRLLSRPLPPLDEYFSRGRPSASCQDRRVSAIQ